MAAMFMTSVRPQWLSQMVTPIKRSYIRVQQRTIAQNNSFLHISEEVREALNSKKPVVALETTIYTHGYPYPENVALASHLESIVRVNGGIPATIGIVDGIAKVGMGAEELIRLTSSAGQPSTLKLSRRDLGFVCGMRLAGKNYNGGTTIAGTMVLAHLAGIKVFATGGLGGVHRGAESSMDISADLTELGRTPVAVISSGCKSFLDIPRTLEYLETEGVCVATFADGRDGKVDFPAFWSRESGFTSPMTIKDEKQAAAIIYAQTTLPLSSGLHFANPIPTSASIPKSEMDIIISEAIKQADEAGARGNDNTPFILSKIKELSGGKSLTANKELICSNVERGTRVAAELARLESTPEATISGVTSVSSTGYVHQQTSTLEMASDQKNAKILETESSVLIDDNPPRPDIIVAGALAIDYSCDYSPLPNTRDLLSPQMYTSNPAQITPTIGGVANNIAKAAHTLGCPTRLCSIIGDDLAGRAAIGQLKAEGMDTNGIKVLDTVTGARTAQYVAVNDVEKTLVLAMADMTILESPQAEFADSWEAQIKSASPKWLVVDANWKSTSLLAWLRAGKAAGAMTAFEPVSVAKSTRLFPPKGDEDEKSLGVFPNHIVDMITPNTLELSAMHTAACEAGLLDTQEWWRVIDALGIPSSGARHRFVQITSGKFVDQGTPQRCIQLLPFTPTILTKLGSEGVLLTMLLENGDPRLKSRESLPYILSRRMNDDGDSKVGGIYMRLFPPAEILGPGEVVSVNGAGDTFLGALVAGLSRRGENVENVLMTAQQAAVLTLKSHESVSPMLREMREQFKSTR